MLQATRTYGDAFRHSLLHVLLRPTVYVHASEPGSQVADGHGLLGSAAGTCVHQQSSDQAKSPLQGPSQWMSSADTARTAKGLGEESTVASALLESK